MSEKEKMMVLLVYGDQYLYDSHIRKAAGRLEVPDVNLMRAKEWGDSLCMWCRSVPFLEDRKIAVLEMQNLKAGMKQGKALLEYIKNPSGCTDLYLCAGHVDRRSEIYRELSKKECVREFPKAPLEDVYMSVRKRLIQKYSCKPEMIDRHRDIFMERLKGYQYEEDYNLYRVMKYADMIGSAGTIDRETIEYFIPETFTQKSYELSKYMIQGREAEMVRLAGRLVRENDENRIGLLSLVLSQIRICYKASLYPEMSRREIIKRLGIGAYQLSDGYENYHTGQYAKAYASLQDGVNALKSGKDADSAFMLALLNASAALHNENGGGQGYRNRGVRS